MLREFHHENASLLSAKRYHELSPSLIRILFGSPAAFIWACFAGLDGSSTKTFSILLLGVSVRVVPLYFRVIGRDMPFGRTKRRSHSGVGTWHIRKSRRETGRTCEVGAVPLRCFSPQRLHQ